ncbi:hypothetical protein BCR34DRAFT_601925 [Clohesyomyces aquaticus]|uniref:Uncharacterized protein n=1 Tax=Clohesyomyces aquaticus TaxID=1231657 RepID=A0A1Y1ZLB3_9PLEO|nr:hypothetical protein BCR34DRAFT_601925 [Clohesyomyces aquaticus]
MRQDTLSTMLDPTTRRSTIEATGINMPLGAYLGGNIEPMESAELVEPIAHVRHPFLFLRLPKDICLMVYERTPLKHREAKVTSHEFVVQIEDSYLELAIFQAYRLIHNEAAHFLLKIHRGNRLPSPLPSLFRAPQSLVDAPELHDARKYPIFSERSFYQTFLLDLAHLSFLELAYPIRVSVANQAPDHPAGPGTLEAQEEKLEWFSEDWKPMFRPHVEMASLQDYFAALINHLNVYPEMEKRIACCSVWTWGDVILSTTPASAWVRTWVMIKANDEARLLLMKVLRRLRLGDLESRDLEVMP